MMNAISNYNPISVAIYFITVVGISMFSMDPVLISISLFGAVMLYLLLNGRNNIKTHLWSILFFIAMAVINPIFSHNGVTVLFVVNDSPITLEAIIYGFAMSGMIISVLYWFRIFSQIMTSDKLLYLFGALSPKIALIISMALRYVPLFSRQAKRVDMSQKALGLYKEESLPDNIRAKTRIFSVMVTWALEHGITTADSMTARGYGIGKRSRFSLFRFTKNDFVLIITSVVLFALTLIFTSHTDFSYYPALTFSANGYSGYIGYSAYFILALLPTLIEVKEALKWRYLISKI